jgi:hypothetical protein
MLGRIVQSTKGKLRAVRRPLSTSDKAPAIENISLSKLSEEQLESFTQTLSPSTREEVSKQISRIIEQSRGVIAEIPEPSREDLKLIALATGIPFIGFGLMDNAILIIAGDAIDTSLGVVLGISTMCAAAIGNIISDVAGVLLGTVIEEWCAKYLNLPKPNLSNAQRQLRSVRYANQFGMAAGIVVGCIIGMFPLLWIDSKKIEAKKREAHLDSIFRDVVQEASKLVGAEVCHLFLIVDQDPATPAQPHPTPDGKFLYLKYDTGNHFVGNFIPLGRGIISRAALTGEAWNIYDAPSEPDYVANQYVDWGAKAPVRNMLCVPILDAQGRPIGVLQAVNKLRPGKSGTEVQGFSPGDVQLFKALASHIGVTLQRMYGDQTDDEEMRLRDTITMLKDYGIEGLNQPGEAKVLFPADG